MCCRCQSSLPWAVFIAFQTVLFVHLLIVTLNLIYGSRMLCPVILSFYKISGAWIRDSSIIYANCAVQASLESVNFRFWLKYSYNDEIVEASYYEKRNTYSDRSTSVRSRKLLNSINSEIKYWHTWTKPQKTELLMNRWTSIFWKLN